MNALSFSQTAIFCLRRLVTQYYYFTGVRHRLTDEFGILDLLKKSASMTHSNVRAAYRAFIKKLDQRQIEMLVAQGVEVPARDAIQ
ncbi:MAG: hypothetical protein EOO52_01870 [Gammaproteobacteria bacterium]|nr:MAG: hypothetical protein EOO52_01870 [Gammaproteobacteria bacterium]